MKILRNKRGAALESAILFMMVVLMLGMLLTGVIMYTHLRVKANDTLLSRELTIEQIGEDFVHGTLILGDNGEIDNYYADVANTDGVRTLTLKNITKTKVLLYIVVNAEGSVTCWRYSAPTPNE